MSLLCSGVSETPSLAWHVVIYNDREYIPVIKCIGYKQNHGAGPDLLPPHLGASESRIKDSERVGIKNHVRYRPQTL